MRLKIYPGLLGIRAPPRGEVWLSQCRAAVYRVAWDLQLLLTLIMRANNVAWCTPFSRGFFINDIWIGNTSTWHETQKVQKGEGRR